MDCHSAHTGKLKLAVNVVCLECHGGQPNPEQPAYAAAAGAIDTPADHFHPTGSAGTQCVACHMPAKTYMQIRAACPRPAADRRPR